ncbi:particle associated protein [Yersinia phage fHe-Yen8-01]|nr:particle associated protein [Yersinia phage fHe-Yen8-01]
MSKKLSKKLTMAQVYTLRRLRSGTQYLLSGNGLKGTEKRRDGSSIGGWNPVNAPSIPVLYRLGLVKFYWPDRAEAQPTKAHSITLTHAAFKVLTETEDRTE